MANLIGIAGESGTGKSHSLRNLDPKETMIINTLNKPLPWKGSMGDYNAEQKNYVETMDYAAITKFLNSLATTPSNFGHVRNIILDDIGMVMMNEYMKRAAEGGYTKFTEIAQHMFQIINASRALPSKYNIALMFHLENVESNGIIVSKKIKTVGKMIDEKFEPQSVMSVLLYSKVSYGEDDTPTYKFVTQREKLYPAKSPEGMFDSAEIDNDLAMVFEKSREYYGLK